MIWSTTMATEKTPATTSELTNEMTELLREFISASRNLYPKKATKRGISRALTTIKSVIADIEAELSK